MWERACSRKRCVSQQGFRLTRPLREQARSHRGVAVFGWSLADIQKHLADGFRRRSLDSAHPPYATESVMNYFISLGIGLGVGLLYGALDFRSPAPPAIALVGLLGMLAGDKLWPIGRQLRAGWST